MDLYEQTFAVFVLPNGEGNRGFDWGSAQGLRRVSNSLREQLSGIARWYAPSEVPLVLLEHEYRLDKPVGAWIERRCVRDSCQAVLVYSSRQQMMRLRVSFFSRDFRIMRIFSMTEIASECWDLQAELG